MKFNGRISISVENLTFINIYEYKQIKINKYIYISNCIFPPFTFVLKCVIFVVEVDRTKEDVHNY